MSDLIPENILANLPQAFSKDEKGLICILTFLSSQAECPNKYTQILEFTLGRSFDMFQRTAKQLVDDIDKAREDPSYPRLMADIWDQFLKPAEEEEVTGQSIDWSIVLRDASLAQNVTMLNLAVTLSKMPPDTAAKLIREAVQVCKTIDSYFGSAFAATSEGALVKLRGVTGTVVTAGLALVYLAWDVIVSIRMCWRGEITGARCAKTVVDKIVASVAGIGGGFAGSIAGSFLAPGLGTIVGAVIGGIVATEAAHVLSDWITQKLFGVPKEVALENAFVFLGISCSSSNDVINKAFRSMCLKHHPDKGGCYEDWHKLQVCMAIIRQSKEN